MKKRVGTIAIFGLAFGAVAVLVLTQMSRIFVSGATVSAATSEDFSVEGASEFPSIVGDGLTFEDVQVITVNALVVDGATDLNSFVHPDGTSFSVASALKPGEGYQMRLALNNTSDRAQVTELVVDMPKSLSVEVDVPVNQAATFAVEKVSSNRWTIITMPSDDEQEGHFDLVITAYAFRYLDYAQSLTRFNLRKPYQWTGDTDSDGDIF